MQASIMKNKRIWIGLLFLAFWIVLWELCSTFIDLSFAVPHPIPTFKVLLEMLLPIKDPTVTLHFWITVISSAARILLGFILGIIAGLILFLISSKIQWLDIGIRQLMVAIKATPVASFIMVLWILIGRDSVPIAIALLMVAPIVYQSIYDGYRQLDPSLNEMLATFRVPLTRRMRIFIIPQLVRYISPALLSAAGLAWKAGIAAEIIAYTKNSIGRELSDAKSFFEGEALFAWTIAVILLSLLLEWGITKLNRRLTQRVRRDNENKEAIR